MRAARMAMNPIIFNNFELLVPDSTITNTGWTLTGAATAHAALADESDSTYVQANGGAGGYTLKVGFADPIADLGRTVKAIEFTGNLGGIIGGVTYPSSLTLAPSSLTTGATVPSNLAEAIDNLNPTGFQSQLIGADGTAVSLSDMTGLTLQFTGALDTYNSPIYRVGKLRAKVWYAASALVLWRPITIPSGSTLLFSVAYGNSTFVASGTPTGVNNTAFATSSDGITWTARSGGANSKTYNHLAFGNGVFVALCSASTDALYSTDGISWSTAAGINKTIKSVCFANGTFVAISGSGTQTARAFTSTDGATWTARTTPNVDISWRYIAYANGVYCGIGDDGGGTPYVMTSSDGTTWTLTDETSTGLPNVHAGSSSRFVGVKVRDSYYSTNGTSWTKVTNAFPSRYTAQMVVHDGTRFIAFGTYSGSGPLLPLVYVSSDGSSWSAVTNQTMTSISGTPAVTTCMVYQGGRYYLVGGDKLRVSQELT